MLIKRSYFLLFIPLVLAFFAVASYGFFFKAAVPGSCALILAIIFRRRMKSLPDIYFVLAAFLFSIAGDWFLSNKGDSFMMFSAGIGLYLLAHVGYLWFALLNGKLHKLFTILVLTGFLLFFFVKLYPAIDDTVLLIATLLYLLISCFSLGAAFGLKLAPLVKWSYFAGVTFILFSDTIIALFEYTSYEGMNFLILPTYYAAHISITFALMRRAD
jgi:uncharacterized membrane protein YhhN